MSGIIARLRAWWRASAQYEEAIAEAQAAVSRLEDQVERLRKEIDSRYGGTS
jgi:hypothetical protein